jgi:hypothetical protein
MVFDCLLNTHVRTAQDVVCRRPPPHYLRQNYTKFTPELLTIPLISLTGGPAKRGQAPVRRSDNRHEPERPPPLRVAGVPERVGAGVHVPAAEPRGRGLRGAHGAQEGAEPEEPDGPAHGDPSEEDAKLAQKLGQLQPFIAVSRQECMGQLAAFGPT